MITAVDTNVLLDVFTADPKFGPRSRDALRRGRAEGQLVACEIVWAELAGAFSSAETATTAMEGLEISFDAIDRDVALAAGQAWRAHRAVGGARQRILADFVIGAHALLQAERLLTRDRGFYRSGFADLEILGP